MDIRRKRPFHPFIVFIRLICFMTPFLAAPTLRAEPLILQRALEAGVAERAPAESGAKWFQGIDLNENGDMVVRCGKVLFTLAYNPSEDTFKQQEQAQIIQRQDCPVISGISLKVSLSF